MWPLTSPGENTYFVQEEVHEVGTETGVLETRLLTTSYVVAKLVVQYNVACGDSNLENCHPTLIGRLQWLKQNVSLVGKQKANIRRFHDKYQP